MFVAIALGAVLAYDYNNYNDRGEANLERMEGSSFDRKQNHAVEKEVRGFSSADKRVEVAAADRLSSNQMTQMTRGMQRMTPAQLRIMTAGEKMMSPMQLAAITKEETAKLSAGQLRAIALAYSHMTLAGLKQVMSMKDNMRLHQLKALVDQEAKMSAHQIAHLNAHDMIELEHAASRSAAAPSPMVRPTSYRYAAPVALPPKVPVLPPLSGHPNSNPNAAVNDFHPPPENTNINSFHSPRPKRSKQKLHGIALAVCESTLRHTCVKKLNSPLTWCADCTSSNTAMLGAAGCDTPTIIKWCGTYDAGKHKHSASHPPPPSPPPPTLAPSSPQHHLRHKHLDITHHHKLAHLGHVGVISSKGGAAGQGPQCDPTKGCNVCSKCCQIYIPAGGDCNHCVLDQCFSGSSEHAHGAHGVGAEAESVEKEIDEIRYDLLKHPFWFRSKWMLPLFAGMTFCCILVCCVEACKTKMAGINGSQRRRGRGRSGYASVRGMEEEGMEMGSYPIKDETTPAPASAPTLTPASFQAPAKQAPVQEPVLTADYRGGVMGSSLGFGGADSGNTGFSAGGGYGATEQLMPELPDFDSSGGSGAGGAGELETGGLFSGRASLSLPGMPAAGDESGGDAWNLNDGPDIAPSARWSEMNAQ